jgi:hypothetical protein
MRKFFITDLHGCYEGLLECLKMVEFDKDKDMLISGVSSIDYF